MLYVFDRLQTEFLFHFVKKEKYFSLSDFLEEIQNNFCQRIAKNTFLCFDFACRDNMVMSQSFDSVRGAITETLAELVVRPAKLRAAAADFLKAS